MNYKTKGFSIVEIVLVVAIVAVLALLGWKAWDTYVNNKPADTTQGQQVNTEQAPAVTDNSGLDASTATLDAINIDGTESSQLNTQTDF